MEEKKLNSYKLQIFKKSCPLFLKGFLPKREITPSCKYLQDKIYKHNVHRICYDITRSTTSEYSDYFLETYDKCCKEYNCVCGEHDTVSD